MSTLKEKLEKKKRAFDHREPEKDHLARFILKLEEDQEKMKRRRSPWFVLKIAASVVILITAGYMVFNYMTNGKSMASDQVNLISYSPEMNQMMAYYDEVSLAKMNTIDELVTDDDEAAKIKQTAYNSLEDLDIRLAAIEKEYAKNPDNSVLKAALINNKRQKVEIMDRIIMQIDFANTQLY
jgi:hypothetical protein